MMWTVFAGAADGLLLCLHPDLAVHLEADQTGNGHCTEDCDEDASSLEKGPHCLECVDLAITGQNLPVTREDAPPPSGAPSTALPPVWQPEPWLGAQPTRAPPPSANTALPRPAWGVLIKRTIVLLR